MKNFSLNKKIIIIAVAAIIAIIAAIIIFLPKNKETKNVEEQSSNSEVSTVDQSNDVQNKDVSVVDLNSKTRPYAVVVNNTPVAVKVQTGLNKAYLVYEIPTEGNTSRLMALFKTKEDVTIGTIRSSRHNFIDYALESNAIYVHYGWSHYAEDDEKAGSIDYINGLLGGPFWRNNPENLASEHTAYTSTKRIEQEIKNKGIKAEANTAQETNLLKYASEEVNLSENSKVANKVTIPYGSYQNTTTFVYDQNTKMYTRQEDGKDCIDHETNEKVTTKNIIVQKLSYSPTSDNYYWNLNTVGSGEGYFITNGKAVPIKWSKSNRKEKTKYTYLDGKEINVNDGRTYIEIQTTSQPTTIE